MKARRPLRDGAYASSPGWAAPGLASESGGVVLCDGAQVEFQEGEQRVQLRAGESVLAPRRLIIAFCPAAKMAVLPRC